MHVDVRHVCVPLNPHGGVWAWEAARHSVVQLGGESFSAAGHVHNREWKCEVGMYRKGMGMDEVRRMKVNMEKGTRDRGNKRRRE